MEMSDCATYPLTIVCLAAQEYAVAHLWSPKSPAWKHNLLYVWALRQLFPAREYRVLAANAGALCIDVFLNGYCVMLEWAYILCVNVEYISSVFFLPFLMLWPVSLNKFRFGALPVIHHSISSLVTSRRVWLWRFSVSLYLSQSASLSLSLCYVGVIKHLSG